jgi:hypothetical protein
MAYPNQGKLIYGIVCQGGYGDTENFDPELSGGVKVIFPEIEGTGVDVRHKAWSRNASQGTQHGAINNNPPPENGTAVLCYKFEGQGGTNHLQIMSALPDIAEEKGIPGNTMGGWENPALKLARNFETSVNKPPKAGSGEADSRPPKEQGAYNTNMTKGIISTASLAPLIGMVIPQITNVSTATQAFSQILSSELLGQLPGMSMSIGSLMSNMPQALVSELYKNIPPEIGNALTAISGLMQTIEIAESGTFNTATKVNPATFFDTAANLLSGARDVAGLVGAFQQLQSNPSLAGLDSLPPVSFTMSGGPFGDIPMSIDATGAITSLLPEPVQKLAEAFSSLMSNGLQFPGVFPGANMFGGSSGVLNEMFNRLPTEELNTAVQQMQKNVAAGLPSRDKVNKMAGFAMGVTGVVKLGKTALQAVK